MFIDGTEVDDVSCPSEKGKKVNYRQKNQEHIEKLKEKRQRQIQQREKEQKKQQATRERLKKKVLEEALRLRQQKEKEKENTHEITQPPSEKKSRQKHAESLPKVQTTVNDNHHDQRYKVRYLSFLSSLSQGLRQKKQTEEQERKRKEEMYIKLKQELGVNKVESRLTKLLEKKEIPRSHSAQKIVQEVEEQPRKNVTSNKNFMDRNTQYIENIKKKREQQMLKKQQVERQKQKKKEKLKEFVMTTQKQRVLDGVYDDELEKKKKPTVVKNDPVEEEEGSASESEQEEVQPVAKKKKKMRTFPYVTDLNEWKKKNRLPPETKVFIVTGGYYDVKKALRARGWVENPGHTSPCFDFKWTLQGRELDYDNLYDWQMVNHFEKNGAITTKVGLCRNIRNMKWVCNVNQDDFYPKCFDLNDQDDYVYFEQYFKISKAQSVLKLYMRLFNLRQQEDLQKMLPRAKVALEVLKRNIIDIDDLIDKKKAPVVITNKQWQIMAQDQLSAEGLAKKKHLQWLCSIDAKYNNAQPKKKIKKKENKQEVEAQEEQEQDEFTKSVSQLLQDYEQRSPQSSLTDIHNIWILKPAGLSRGRGITTYNNLVEIKDHIKSKQSLWVAQKYIERPLIVCKRKFDIRQWVLVTDFNPLIVWCYQECYIRFSVLDYNAQDVNNKFIHLTNNAIASLHKDFDNSEIKGNMYSMEQFTKFLQQKEGYDVFNEKIKPQIKDIVKWSLQSAQEYIQNRKNSHEMFGYDFMVDESYKVWLIQINSSPSMDYSTHITQRLVKQGLEDTVKVLVDYYSAPKKIRRTIDTGGYKLLFKGTEIPEKPITTGLNLGIEGIPIKKNKRQSIKPKVFNMDGGEKEKETAKDTPKEIPQANEPMAESTKMEQSEPIQEQTEEQPDQPQTV